jgi:hypothetical protein
MMGSASRAAVVHGCAPAGLDDRRRITLDDERGPRHSRAGRQVRPIVDGHVAPAIRTPDFAAANRLRFAARLQWRRSRRRRRITARHYGLELERLDDERGAGGHTKAEMARVQLAERVGQLARLEAGAPRDGQRSVGARDFHEQPVLELRTRCGGALLV